MSENELVLIIDFGSPYNQQLTRKVRELGVYSELHPHTITAEKLKTLNPKAIILSGGPYYVADENKYRVDDTIFTSDIPVLGICYGAQLIAEHYGGAVAREAERTYETKTLTLEKGSTLYKDVQAQTSVHMSKGDTITNVPETFTVDGRASDGGIVSFYDERLLAYGIQFHPEVSGTEAGDHILRNFLFAVSDCAGDWS
ncbi:MAG TPA: glutamine-hydrolyzing GMP synthase, partial [Pseudogracilibacillus sp.]|nr:glutamine-hydrolyzing GMP synthase [Pseudogracilibacillus sp.]